jgi:hypothetical protein
MADLPPDLAPDLVPRGPAPGWYADPWVAGQVRWWDGAAWGSEAGPAAPPPPMMTTAYHPDQSVADPGRAMADESRAATSASAALLVGAVAYALLFVCSAVLYHYVFHSLLDEIERSTRSTTTARGTTVEPFHFPPALLIGSGLLQFVQLGLYAVGAIFLAWFYKAAQLARAAGMPARRTPGLATAGFIIPIVSLWWPYQSVCDLFAPGDPRRRVVGRWWALWLGTQFGAVPVLIASLGPLALGVVAALALAVVATFAALAARQVIARIGEAHAELVDVALGR